MNGNRDLHRRISRTDLNFEEALRAEGTVMLKEGLDVNSMGMDSPASARFDSPATHSKEMRSPRLPQPSTPTVVPPTPSPVAGPSTAKPPPPSPASSSHDLFYDAEDSERQTNRRSMYRSPGTSSSPDLATLLRKAKERGGVVAPHHRREKRNEAPPPLPVSYDRPRNGTRPRSSTSSHSPAPTSSTSPRVTPLPKGKTKATPVTLEDYTHSNSPEWILTSPRSRDPPKENGSKPPKTSVRAKTSAFLGKMLGQGTVRERSKTDASLSPGPATPSYTTPSLFQAFVPPVPPLPPDVDRIPSGSPIADVFSTPQRSPDVTKPLPPIMGDPIFKDSEDVDDRSLVFVEKIPRTPSPDMIAPSKSADTTKASNFGKRRSMSVGEFELKNAMTVSSSITPLPKTQELPRKEGGPGWEDSTLHGILSEFKGELSQLDPVSSSSLDLRDPSTPSRRAAFSRSQTNGLVLSHTIQDEVPNIKTSPSSPSTPTLTLQLPSQTEDLDTGVGTTSPLASPIIPPRTSSLYTPIRSASGPSSIGSPRSSVARRGQSPLRARSGNSVGQGLLLHTPVRGLRIQHRPTASSSEPSLVPAGDEAHDLSSSQQDLTVNDLALTRFPSNSPGRGEDNTDIEARGKELASRCWSEDEEFLTKDKIAEWLGGTGRINKIALHHYIDFFDFSALRLDLAFRRLCAKLYLKGETQQVDRILEEFSRRYWDCNPGGLYGSASVVHAVSYSLLLLNTDLHVAELSARMSRNQFVRNTLTAIQMQLQPSAQISSSDLTYDDCSSSVRGGGSDSADTISRTKRSDSITSWNSVSREAIMSSPVIPQPSVQISSPGQHPNGSTPSVQNSSGHEQRSPHITMAYGRNWENDMESLLKEMYNAVKSQQILQPLGTSLGRSSVSSLSPGPPTMMRNRSQRGPPDRLATLKRGSIRGLQSILGAQSGVSPYSSNSSIDGRVSPSPSFATSTHEAMHGSSSSFLSPTLGFASNLSHTIIREAQEDDDRSIHSQESGSTTISITDEELALLGAPWAKEGMLCRKQYWESAGKRAKDKTWLDVFVVIQKGELNMFIFGEHGGGNSGVVGGGNWLANAQPVGTVHLSHSLAHALPPPGYNRQRPYCMVLTLANGGVYFFQAGTEELVNEWVSTCNYWAARTSKEPLAGGVSNMEYGWNRVAEPFSHGRSLSDNDSMKDTDYSDAISVRSGRSGRSTRSKFGWREGVATVRASHSPWADRTFINDWKPPLPPTVSSLHDEETQLEALQKHVASMKKDLKRHNEFREPMAALYQPRTPNALKAQSNWEKKSQYLLTEIVKYDSYIDSLQSAMSLRLKKRGEKALERALTGATPEDGSPNGAKGKWKGYPEEETIQEDEEPPATPGPRELNSQHHRRETAEGGGLDE